MAYSRTRSIMACSRATRCRQHDEDLHGHVREPLEAAQGCATAPGRKLSWYTMDRTVSILSQPDLAGLCSTYGISDGQRHPDGKPEHDHQSYEHRREQSCCTSTQLCSLECSDDAERTHNTA